jgi:hypothetical protein
MKFSVLKITFSHSQECWNVMRVKPSQNKKPVLANRRGESERGFEFFAASWAF